MVRFLSGLRRPASGIHGRYHSRLDIATFPALMKPRTLRTLLATAIVGSALLLPATASAGSCSLTFNPNPGWRGASITISGFGFTANAEYFVNFGGNPIKTGTTNGNGAFSFNYTIPNDYPVGQTNVFAFTNPTGCEDNPNYQVNASPPTTTTTTTSTTTTTLAPTTTTTLAPTTTAAATTTTAAATTTSAVPADTTTTTVPAENDGGGIPLVVWIGIAALIGVALFLVGKMSSRRR